jgi:cytidylate kinase
MFRILTIEREYGCGAGAIAGEISRRLGWKLWDHTLTEEIAKLANVDCRTVERCDEKVDSTFYRLAKVFWRGSYERSMPMNEAEAFDADCMVTMMDSLAARIAKEGNAVVVGRGSPYFMRDREDTFSVFVYADRNEKIRRLVESGKSSPEAEELIDTVDHERKTFIKHYFNADWPTRSLYNLMINSGMGDENVIETILETMRRVETSAVTAELSARRG